MLALIYSTAERYAAIRGGTDSEFRRGSGSRSPVGAQAHEAAPDWAYGYLTPVGPGDKVAPPCPEGAKGFPDCAYAGAPVPEDGVKHTLPDSSKRLTRAEVFFDYGPADWYPEDHPAMPAIVAKGKQSDGSRACALCHYPNGMAMETATWPDCPRLKSCSSSSCSRLEYAAAPIRAKRTPTRWCRSPGA